MRTEHINDRIHEIHFESPLDMEGLKPSPSNVYQWSVIDSGIGRHAQWSMCRDVGEFDRRLKHGWPELMEMVLSLESRLTFDAAVASGLIMQTKRRQVRRDNGDVLDFDEFKRGNVDTCWQTTERHRVESKRQRAAVLDVNLVANGGVEAHAMLWRTALAHLVAKKLTAAGWMVEIISSTVTEGSFIGDGPSMLAVTTVAKPSNIPLSLERLALVTSPAWFRLAVWRAFMSNEQDREIRPTFGYASNDSSPHVTRLEDRGYLALTINASTLSQRGAQDNLNSICKQITAHV